ncbi:unnamed protein product, partial [Pocillopora meandrina]
VLSLLEALSSRKVPHSLEVLYLLEMLYSLEMLHLLEVLYLRCFTNLRCFTLLEPIISDVIPNASGSNFIDKVKLQEQQSALQLQQTRIIEMLAANQSKSRLPQPRVSTFDGVLWSIAHFFRA